MASTKQQDELDEDALGDIPFEFLGTSEAFLRETVEDWIVLQSFILSSVW